MKFSNLLRITMNDYVMYFELLCRNNLFSPSRPLVRIETQNWYGPDLAAISFNVCYNIEKIHLIL